MVWKALIGAGASILGSVFGSGSKKQQTTTTSHVDYKRMVRDAEAAGFNPLTALRNGGAAGFSVSTSSTPATPLSARLADGVSSGVNAFLQNYDPHADAAREQGSKLIEAQIANLNASTAELTQRHFTSARGAAALSKGAAGRVMLDGYQYGGTGDGGAVEDMWVVFRNPDGTHSRVPNPNLPDGEQLLIPPVAAVENATTRPILSDRQQQGHKWPDLKEYELPNIPGIIYDWWNSEANKKYNLHRRKYK